MGEAGESLAISPKSNMSLDYSYTTRKTKQYLRPIPNQPLITDYIKMVCDIELSIQQNPKLSSLIKANCDNKIEFSTEVLQRLFTNASNNAEHLPKQRRHDEIIKKFSMSLFFMAGPAAYEMLHQNLPEALPSLSLVKKEMRKHYSNFTEGVFRFDKLSTHLDAYQAPRVISISEDATRIISRIEYDPSSDKLVGFVLPVDKNCLPLTDTFLATSFEQIEKMFMDESRSTFAYVYMAQSMATGVPPFCLNITGINN